MATRPRFLFQTSLIALLAFCVAAPMAGDVAGTPVCTPVPTMSAAVQVSPTAVVALPTSAPTPIPAPEKKLVTIQNLTFSLEKNGVKVNVEASAPLKGRISSLKNPDRILVVFRGATLPGRKLAKEIGLGAVLRGRLAQHPDDSVWLVLEMAEQVKYTVDAHRLWGYSVTFATGVPAGAPKKPVAISPRVDVSAGTLAHLPKINLMFYDTNVMFQGKQYERFPCANFIYEKTDQFPLKREFGVTLVFYEGYGAFIGNLRVADPRGNIIWQTQEPFAFNLFSQLSDYFVEVPCKLEFPERGYYALILTLNSEDVREQDFYVGYSDDRPEKVVKK